MSRLTGNGAKSLMEAYNAVYAPTISEDYLYEEFLTEEFILEAYHYVADFLVHEGYVPGYETAELFMSEMDEHWIDEILCDYGLYLGEGLFSNFANTVIGGAKRAAGAVAGGVRKAANVADKASSAVAGGVKKAVNTAATAAQTVKGTAQRAAGAVTRGATAATQAVSGAAQRAGSAVVKAATPVAQAVKGTAQRAVAAGQSVLNRAGDAAKTVVQGTGKALNTAGRAAVDAGKTVVGGTAQAVRGAAGAVAGAAGKVANKIGQEIEISRKVGAGEPLTKPAPVVPTAKPAPTGNANKPAPVVPTAKPAPTGNANKPAPVAAKPAPVAAKPTTTPAAGTPATPANGAVANKRPSLASQAAELRAMRKASQERTTAMGGKPATALVQGFDMFDIVQGYLIDEGFADTEDAALAIMANMSEEWRNQIIESSCGGSHSGKKPAKKQVRSGY